MASPMYTIDGRQDGKIKEHWSTNNRAVAETMAESYQKKYGEAWIYKFSRIEQGVAMYEALKKYEGAK